MSWQQTIITCVAIVCGTICFVKFWKYMAS